MIQKHVRPNAEPFFLEYTLVGHLQKIHRLRLGIKDIMFLLPYNGTITKIHRMTANTIVNALFSQVHSRGPSLKYIHSPYYFWLVHCSSDDDDEAQAD